MARLSDIIESFLKEMIIEEEGTVEIQRNELASKFNCVPSQNKLCHFNKVYC